MGKTKKSDKFEKTKTEKDRMNFCRFLLRNQVFMTKALWSNTMQSVPVNRFTMPMVNFQPAAGLKHVVNPRRRCSHCYMVFEDERVWVLCDKYPRHKQVTRQSKHQARNQMILSHATNGGTHRRSSRGRMHMWTQDGMRMDF